MKSYKHILLFIAMAAVAIAIGAVEHPDISELHRTTLSQYYTGESGGSWQHSTPDCSVDLALSRISNGNALRSSLKRNTQRNTASSRWIPSNTTRTSRKELYNNLSNGRIRLSPHSMGIKSRAEIVIRMRKLII